MSNEVYTAKTTDSDPVEVSYDFGGNLEEAVSKFGEDVVYARYKASAVIDLQSLIRGQIRKVKEGEMIDVAVIQEVVAAWVPGVRQARGKSSEEKAKDAIGKLTPEARAALLAELLAGTEDTEPEAASA